MKKIYWAIAGLFLVGAVFLFLHSVNHKKWSGQKKLIILGIDGMDPQLLRRFIGEGKMPNFARLIQEGSFREMATSTPPQSPVAWSNLITGLNAGGHGIFDFIHRDPKTMELYFSTSRVMPSAHSIHIGNWIIPLGGGHAEQLRKGKAFWEILDYYGVPNLIFRIPANFPPIAAKGKTMSGMGTPDLRGTYGTFTFYTDDPLTEPGVVEGGQIIPVKVQNSRVRTELIGPDNPFRKSMPIVTKLLEVTIDPQESVARISVGDRQLVLREGEWSDWVHVHFEMVPFLARVDGICRFYLKQVHPRFQLYVSPMNIDPANPALPISTPGDYSKSLTDDVGEFYTQGIAEDTKALSAGVLDDDEYLDEARTVMAEHRRIFDVELPRFKRGVFFFYFSSLDLNSHMFWRLMDPQHPAYDATLASRNGSVIRDFYQQIDQVLGETLPYVDSQTTLLVLSDHGFAPYTRSFNLNTWLQRNGYLNVRDPSKSSTDPFANIDWNHTRAYGLGLNGLYLNLKGREESGIVFGGASADALLSEIKEKLLALKDPKTGLPVITHVDLAREVYKGPYSASGPDLIVGYNRGYRVGWQSILGGLSLDILEDNINRWSGDHCIDPTLVPGVLLSNREITAPLPTLTDIAPTILEEFNIPKVKGMMGHSVFRPDSGMNAIH